MHRSWRVLLFIYFNVLVGHSSSVFFLSESLESIQKQRSLIVCKIIEWNIEFPYVFYTIRIRKTFTKKLKTGRFECSAIWNVFNLMGISQEYLKNMSLSFRCEHPQHVALCVEFWWELLIKRKCKNRFESVWSDRFYQTVFLLSSSTITKSRRRATQVHDSGVPLRNHCNTLLFNAFPITTIVLHANY